MSNVARFVKPKKANSSSVSRDSKNGLVQFSTTNQKLRYSDLPDFNSHETDEQIMNKLNERFEVLKLMTQDAIAGDIRSMIVSGPGGVGKTYTMDNELDKWDPDRENFTTASGYMRPTGLYKLLYKHRHPGDIIKLDDMDSVFYDDTSLNFIKIATDTTQERILTYAAETKMEDEETGEPIPRQFEYNGTMLFITNLDFDAMIEKNTKLSNHLEAMVTRAHYIDLMMKTKRDYLLRVYQVVEQGLFDNRDMTDEMIDDTLEFIDKYHPNLRECSLRMALKVGGLRKNADPQDTIPWDRKALLTCCRGVM